MGRRAPAFGALIAVCGLAGVAEAKLVRYEIEGQRYTYSTNNIEQAAVARERIAAGKAAAEARAKAEAERAANPLARAFGSQAQRDAAAADAKLRELLARGASEGVGKPRVARTPAAPEAERKPRPRPTVQAARRSAPDPVNTGSLERQNPARLKPAIAPDARPVPAAPKVEAIVYDFASGIKTIHMADGTVDEDAFDRTMAASLKRSQRADGPRITFVNEAAADAAAESTEAGKR